MKTKHHVYALLFKQSDIPKKRVTEFWQKVREIIDYGEKIPQDDTLVFYIGESFRYEKRMQEHEAESFDLNHPTYNYHSRNFIRLLASMNINFTHQSLNSFPKGSDTPDDFEQFYFSKYANAGHPVTNMARCKDIASIPRLSQAEDITEYRNIKSQIEHERKNNKLRIDHKSNATAIQQSEMTSDVVDAIDKLSEHFKTLADNATDKTEKSAYRYASTNTTALVLRTIKCPVSYRDIVGSRAMSTYLAQALSDKLEIPEQFNNNTNYNDLSEADQELYIEWMMDRPVETPPAILKRITKFR